MKPSTLVGVLSLAANAALLGVIVIGAASPAPKSGAVSKRPAVAAKQAEQTAAADLWAQMRATDLAAQRDRLQAEGFPPSAIRALLAAQIRERSAARRKAIESALANLSFWKSPIPDPQAQAQLRAIAREEQNALKELLGPDPVNSFAARLRRQVPELPTDKSMPSRRSGSVTTNSARTFMARCAAA